MSPTNGNESGVPIAIVGLSCRFPGDASSPSGFWELLKNGRSGFSESTDRYNAEAFYHPLSGKRQNVIPTKGGYLLKENPYVFDAAFFNITAAEAMALDPRQRIAMEVAYEALENAGMPLQKVAGTQTACFMGSSMSDYRDAVSRDFGNFPKYHILGVSDEMISNRISHFLDIHGPSATIQTACSSSLVATHIACQSLRSGESDMAIAGGVGLVIGTDGTMHLNNLGFLNPAGHSRSFDADAGGYGRGEGCGVIILKRLDSAIRDGDNIRAIIRASGVNSDGWTQGVTMPSLEAQTALIKYVYESNGLDYGSTQYVEAHGTGTKVGDPIESGAIHNTIGQSKSKSRKQLYMGSVKASIGHLEAAAGVASIIKGVLALEHLLIPPNINFSKPNPSIPLDDWNMVVPTKLTPWPAAQIRRMSVSGFGMGGTNAHLVMEAFNGPSSAGNGISAPQNNNKKRIFVFSSHDKAGFRRVANALGEYLGALGSTASNPGYLANLAHTLAVARSGLAWRTTCFAENVAELREHLLTGLGDDAVRTPSTPPRIGFVFTGQGAQWARMGIEMLERPVFSGSVAKSAQFLKEMGCEWNPVSELTKAPKESRLGVPEISQPICSVLQIALVDELRSWGVVPSKVVGHSSGEIAAAYTIGAISHRDALAAAYFRGTASAGLRKKQRNAGGMMAVGCSRDEAEKTMMETKLEAVVACVNSPSNVTLSGDAVTIEALRSVFDGRGIFARRLKVDVAYHSSHMHLCSAEYYASIADIEHLQLEDMAQTPRIIMVSSVTGTEADPELLAPYYWIQNLISPVLFTAAVKELVSPADANGEKVIDLLIEVGPHSALGGPIEQILASHGIKNVDYTSMLTRGQSALETSLNLAAELFRQGVSVNVPKANADSNCRLLTDLPPYTWNHSEKFRAESRMQRELTGQQFPTRSLLGAMMPTVDESERVWRGFIRLNDEPWLRGHMVGMTVLFPAAGMISVVLEAAQQLVEAGKTPLAFKLRDISFLAAMALSEDVPTEITVHMRPHLLATSGSVRAVWWEFTVSSCVGPTGQMRNNCRGLANIVYEENRSLQMAQEGAKEEAMKVADYHRVLLECPEKCSKDYFYDRFVRSSIPYGDVFQGVENCHPGSGKSCYAVKIADIGETFTKNKLERPFFIHAAALDAILQGWLGSTCDEMSNNTGDFGFENPMVPAAIGELEISVEMPGDVGYTMPGFCRSHKQGFTEFSANISMLDKDLSKVLISIADFRLTPLEMEDTGKPDGEGGAVGVDPAEIISKVHWDYALDFMGATEINQVVLGDDTTTAEDKLLKLLRMVIHQRPAVKAIELVETQEQVSNAIMSRLPKGVMLPSHVHYAVIDGNSNNNANMKNDKGTSGQSFVLGALDAPLPTYISSADLLIIPHQVSLYCKEGLGSILERLVRMAKPGALVVIASSGNIGEITSRTLNDKGFELVSCSELNNESLAFYRHTNSIAKKSAKQLTNGVHREQVSIIEPAATSHSAQIFSKKLQELLKDQGYSVTSHTGAAGLNVTSGTIYISLLELEKPMLDDLSEPAFQNIRKLMVGCDRLLWITCGDNPSLGIVDGLSRCVSNELAGAKIQILHLSSKGIQHGPSLALRILNSSAKTADDEFLEQDGILQVQRIYENPTENNQIRRHIEDSTQVVSLNDDSAGFHLTIGKPGLLDSLRFVREESAITTPLADYELELQVKATGINFRDVMASMGLVPVKGLGLEASGIVLRTGSRASESFKPGDRVSSVSVGGMHATKARCDSRVTSKMPDSMSFEDGAAAPMVHAAAYFSLIRLAKLRQGQSVLIHAAAGGVGQAAIQLATHLGLVVYVTVGTEDKRQLVIDQYGIAEDHIFNSRDGSFAKGIQRMTRGRGVDCVLNSLSGELLRVSWTCLATFGTFVEIGLRDITDNMRLDMRPFSKSATFSALDIPTLIDANPTALGEALNDVFKLLRDGVLRVPYPVTVYPVGQMENAFRLMQQGKHRGKIVLSFSDEDKIKAAPVLCRAKDSLKLDPHATYLFVGGLGGLGRSLARELVASGARHIAFLSRSGDTKPEAKATVDELTAHGAQVKVFCGDIANQESFLAAMDQCIQHLPPVKGVIQMAMILRDGFIENMAYEDFIVPLRPKVQGTWNLHQYFGHERPLDFMIFCSSISGIVGNPGQAQYDAGNSYQDTLAHYRRVQGLKAVSVNLGIMLDVGVIAESTAHNFTVWEQTLGIREPAFHALMKSLINGQQRKRGEADDCPAQVCIGLGTADILAAHNLPSPPWFQNPRFGPLAVTSALSAASGSGEGGNTASLASRLSEAGTNKDISGAASIITDALVGKTAEILRIPSSEVDPSRPMYSYGVDSLVALEVRNWITREMKANMALLDILAAVPMEMFAVEIAQKSKLVVGMTA